MDPWIALVTATRIGLIACLAGVLVWAAHQRAAVHRVGRRGLRRQQPRVQTRPNRIVAATVAGLAQ